MFKRNSVHILIRLFLLAVLLLFLCSTAVFYAMVSHDLASENQNSFILYLAVRALRFLFVLAVCFFLRQKNKDMLVRYNSKRKWFFPVFLIITCIYTMLCVSGIIASSCRKIFLVITGLLPQETPLLPKVVLEQFISSDLLLTVLFGLLVLFFPGFKRSRSV